MTSYQNSLAAEKRIYENCLDVHDLPPIFHYWSNRRLLPKLQPYGFDSPSAFFQNHLNVLSTSGARSRPALLASLGSGNCDLEIDLAQTLPENTVIDCLDVNDAMLERGRGAAAAIGLSSRLNFIPADLNTWTATAQYDAVIANQSLHHVVNLEHLFDQVKQSLRPGGQFLISDMIGRNGHQRWPEALDLIHQFWRRLPPSYRFNQLVGYYEELYQSWDCSVEGFEGVRSEDILPLLLDRFHFRFFLGYGNLIDPFIDRAFGPHFDPASDWDRTFIDEVHERDEVELASGRIKPTHMMALLTNEATECAGNLDPRHSVRRPSPRIVPPKDPPSYEWESWPHHPQQQLEIVCHRLAETGRQIKQRTAWALSLDQQLAERTAWALSRDRDVQSYAARAHRLEMDFEDRTAWALDLQSELRKQSNLIPALQGQINSLETEVETRTLWALRLKQELDEQIDRARRAEAELDNLTHRPLYLLKRIIKSIMKRLWNITP